ncbi:MAG: hypothetical protein OXE92_00420 [Bacteroidetes bacterium]|nr:hypothetical protein [Bacteroidota bacterium]
MTADQQTHASGGSPLEHELSIPSATVLRGATSLRQLRDRVQALVNELDRLRKINQEFAERITELESPGKKNPNSVTLTFDNDKEKLLARINSFIKAIDDYLILEENK